MGMTKWPKEWLDCVQETIDNPDDPSKRLWILVNGEDALNSLHEIGALKDPPKPREWSICWTCTDPLDKVLVKSHVGHDIARVREVLDED